MFIQSEREKYRVREKHQPGASSMCPAGARAAAVSVWDGTPAS